MFSLKTLTITAECLSPHSVITMPCFVGVPTEVFQTQRKNEAGENAVARLNDTLLFHPRASSQTILLGSGGSHEKDASLVIQITTVSSTLMPDTSVLFLLFHHCIYCALWPRLVRVSGNHDLSLL